MVPKYPDSVEWFLIDRHFSKQCSDHNYDNAPHSRLHVRNKISRFKWLVPKAARIIGRHNTSSTFLNTHTRNNANTWHQKPQIFKDFLNDMLKMLHNVMCF